MTDSHPAPVPILHLITAIEPGGAERQLLTLLRALDRDRFSPALAFLKGPPVLARAFEEAGVPVFRLRSGPWPHVLTVPSLIALMRRRGVRILHTHLIEAELFGSVAARLASVPVLIASRHNDDSFLRRAPVAFAQRQWSRSADRVVVISDALGRFVFDRRAVDESAKVVRIYYGLDPDPNAAAALDRARIRAEFGAAPDDFVVGVVARLTEQKGHRYLFEGFASLLQRYPTGMLLVIGVGELRASLEELARHLRIDGRVRFTGFRSDVANILHAIDVLALPSLWEGFGLVLLEAMAAARPIVASDVSAIPEIVDHGRTGLLVPPRDAVALAGALADLASSAQRREEMGRRGRERLEQSFSVERMCREMERLYDEELAGDSRRLSVASRAPS